MSEASELTAAAHTAVRDACRVCRAVRHASAEPTSLTKPDDSPVTIADFAAQAVVLHRLSERLGTDLSVVAEEDADLLLRGPDAGRRLALVIDAARVAWPEATDDDVLRAIELGRTSVAPDRPFWALDPIDGTKGFLRGGQFAVCLARIERDRPTLGLLGCPHLPGDLGGALDRAERVGTLFVADASGATWEPLDDPGAARPLVADAFEPRRCVVTRSFESGHTRADEIERVLAAAGHPATEVLAVDSQAKYALVARGRADAYLRLPHDRTRRDPIWDHAAGAVVAAATGMVVTDASGRDLCWRRGARLEDNFGILCARPELHETLAAAAAAVLVAEAPEER